VVVARGRASSRHHERGGVSRVPDYVGTWWQSRCFKRRIQLIGRVGTDRFVARHQKPKGGSKTYRVTLYTLQCSYRQIPPPKERKNTPSWSP
jgi:hypothetical protein